MSNPPPHPTHYPIRIIYYTVDEGGGEKECDFIMKEEKCPLLLGWQSKKFFF